MKRHTFDCGWYLDPAARRIALLAGTITVLILVIAVAAGYGTNALGVAGATGLTVAVTEGGKAMFRLRRRPT
ncbi:hypothetical protein AB0C24_32645 [Amycolatopsis japonica]|uniref:hypothetical protein n=1 Tax=Amycolatopsis japonica TaxID=208439 RepID=UPI0033E21B96